MIKVEDSFLVLREDGHGVSEEAEASDAAIGVHVQADVCVLLLGGVVEFPPEPLRWATLLNAEDGLPTPAVAFP